MHNSPPPQPWLNPPGQPPPHRHWKVTAVDVERNTITIRIEDEDAPPDDSQAWKRGFRSGLLSAWAGIVLAALVSWLGRALGWW